MGSKRSKQRERHEEVAYPGVRDKDEDRACIWEEGMNAKPILQTEQRGTQHSRGSLPRRPSVGEVPKERFHRFLAIVGES